MKSWEETFEMVHGGPSAMTRELLSMLRLQGQEPRMKYFFTGLQALIDQIDLDKKWLKERCDFVALECERLAALARTMREHGLKTYTNGDVTLTVAE